VLLLHDKITAIGNFV